MPETLEHRDLTVATAHDLLMVPEGVRIEEGSKYRAPRHGKEYDFSRIVRAAEIKLPRGTINVNLTGGESVPMPLFEVGYFGLERRPEMSYLIAGLALNQTLVVSRIGGRYLPSVGLMLRERSFGHPAKTIRDDQTGKLLAARQIGVPQPIDYRGPDNLTSLDVYRQFDPEITYNLENYLPEDMFFDTGESFVQVPNCGQTADVNYDYNPVAITRSGVIIAESYPREVANLPPQFAPQTLKLVHSEVYIEGLRTGRLSIEEAAQLVVATGVPRDSGNQQLNAFTGLAYFSVETLQDIYERIKF